MSRPRAVLLDALGTLVELEPPLERLQEGLRAGCGVEVDDAIAGAALGAEIAYYRAHLQDGRDQAAVDRLRRRCAEVLRDGLGEAAAAVPLERVGDALLAALRFRPDPGAPGALRALRDEGMALVVVSNWDYSLHQVLEETGLRPLLDGVVASGELGAAKPDRAIFARGLAVAGVGAGEAVHVGDDVDGDVAGARAAGLAAIHVRRPGMPAAPPGIVSITGMGQLPGALARLPSRP